MRCFAGDGARTVRTKDVDCPFLHAFEGRRSRDAPEAADARRAADPTIAEFMREALPGAPKPRRNLAARLIKSTLSQVGKEFSEAPRTPEEIQAYAEAMADMFCAYLASLKPAS